MGPLDNLARKQEVMVDGHQSQGLLKGRSLEPLFCSAAASVQGAVSDHSISNAAHIKDSAEHVTRSGTPAVGKGPS